MRNTFFRIFAIVFACLFCLGTVSAASAWSLKEAAAPYAGTTIRGSNLSGFQNSINAIKLAPLFEKETGIKVIIDEVTYGEAIEKHMMELTSGSPGHDLYDVDNVWFPQYVPYCTPINKFIDNPKLFDPNMELIDFYSQLLEGLSYGGKLYSFSNLACFPSIFYRKDLLEKAGIKPPAYNEAWTTDQYYEAAKKLTQDTNGDGKTDIYGMTLSGARTGIVDEVMTMFWGSGGAIFDDHMKPTFGKNGKYHKDMVKILTLVQKIYKEGIAPPGSTEYEIGEAAGVFEEGIVALSWNWNLCASWMDAPGARQHGKIGVMLIPRDNPNVKRWHRQGNKGWLIAKDSKNQEAAYLFLQWLSSPEIQLKQIEMNDSSPSRKSVLEESQYKDKFTHLEQLRYVMQNQMDRPVPRIPEWSQCDDLMAVYFQKCMVGAMSPEDAADAAATDLERTLKSRGYYRKGKKFRNDDGTYPDWFTGNYKN